MRYVQILVLDDRHRSTEQAFRTDLVLSALSASFAAFEEVYAGEYMYDVQVRNTDSTSLRTRIVLALLRNRGFTIVDVVDHGD